MKLAKMVKAKNDTQEQALNSDRAMKRHNDRLLYVHLKNKTTS
jgi:hypothetical protein